MSAAKALGASPFELELDSDASAKTVTESRYELVLEPCADEPDAVEPPGTAKVTPQSPHGPTAEEPAATGADPAPSNARATVAFDSRRPWPLGLPSKELALSAIVSQSDVDAELEASHLRVLTLLPEWVFDEARTALGGANEVAFAAASAWRAVVAFEHADQLVGLDARALIALTDEAVQAREKLLGASAFALDGGASCEELISALDECIGRFVVLARHHQRTRVVTIGAATKILSATSEPDGKKRKVLPLAFAASLFFAVVFHVARVLAAPSADVWVVNGSIESGHAVLLPGGPDASPAALDAKLSELRAQHVIAAQGPDGQWHLSKEP